MELTSASLVGTADGDGIRVKVNMDLMQDAVLRVAQYAGGKMVGVQWFDISNDNTYYCHGLTYKEGEYGYKAFLVTKGKYAPMCTAISF